MISCVIPTRDRYEQLFSCVLSICIGSQKPNEILIYDDSVKKKNIFKQEKFLYLKNFGIKIEVIPTDQIGQTAIHERSQFEAKYEYIWRVDDDCVIDKNCLFYLSQHISKSLGAVGGLIHIPGKVVGAINREQKIEDTSFHVQMCHFRNTNHFEVEHLHCSFLYKKGIVPFAHKILDPCGLCEETIFSHELYRKGLKVLVEPKALTYHFQSKKGGMRDHNVEIGYNKNRQILEHKKKLWLNIKREDKIIVDANGIGDSIVLQSCLKDIIEPKRPTWIFTQNLDVFKINKYPDTKFLPMTEAYTYFNDYLPENIYNFMERKKWTSPITEAFIEMHRGNSNER